jgi:Tol biopolymer transport system component
LLALTGCTLYFNDSATSSDDDGSGGSGGSGSGSGWGSGGGSGTDPGPDPTPACTSGIPSTGWIVFDADDAQFYRDIYRMRPNGSALERLTDGSLDKEPAPSPDGHLIAFTSKRSGTFQIHLLDLATKNVTQLTHHAGDAFEPSFSHDGTLIAFRSGTSVYTIHVDGTNEQFVTDSGEGEFNAYFTPRFSANDSELVFDRNNEIDAIHLNGTGLRYIVNNWTTSIKSPSVSPSGTSVAYEVWCSGIGIWATPFETATNPCQGRQITPTDVFESRGPAWGPNDLIAYERVGSGNVAQIALISTAPNSKPCLASSGPYDHRNPSWAP